MSYSDEPKLKPVPRPKGILCPDCGEPMGALKTPQYTNIVKRRRYCPHGGKRR